MRSEFLSAHTFKAVAEEYIEQIMVKNGKAEATIVKANFLAILSQRSASGRSTRSNRSRS